MEGETDDSQTQDCSLVESAWCTMSAEVKRRDKRRNLTSSSVRYQLRLPYRPRKAGQAKTVNFDGIEIETWTIVLQRSVRSKQERDTTHQDPDLRGSKTLDALVATISSEGEGFEPPSRSCGVRRA